MDPNTPQTRTKTRSKLLVAAAFCALAAAAAIAASSNLKNLFIADSSGGGSTYSLNDFILPPPANQVPKKFIDLASTFNNTCVAKVDGTVWCWGEGSAAGGVDPSLYNPQNKSMVNPKQVFQNNNMPLTDVKQIVGRGYEQGFCALKNNGTVWCWGRYPQEVTDGNVPLTAKPWLATQIIVSPGVPLTQVAKLGGSATMCAIKTDTSVVCWSNDEGLTYPRPEKNEAGNAPLKGVLAVGGGSDVLCFLSSINNIRKTLCRGSNKYGGLGDGTFIDRPNQLKEVLDPGIANTPFRGNLGVFGSVESVMCAVSSQHFLACWGGRDIYRAHHVFPDNISTPMYLREKNNQIISDIIVMTGSGEDTDYNCILKGDQTVSCWGMNAFGQLGDGTNIDSLTNPVPVVYNGQPIGNINQITTGITHSCVLWANNLIACWGQNDAGQLGNGVDYHQVWFSPSLILVNF